MKKGAKDWTLLTNLWPKVTSGSPAELNNFPVPLVYCAASLPVPQTSRDKNKCGEAVKVTIKGRGFKQWSGNGLCALPSRLLWSLVPRCTTEYDP